MAASWIQFVKGLAASVTTPPSGEVAVFIDSVSGEPYYKDSAGTSTSLRGAAGASGADITVALGDETTAITTGTAKVTMRSPRTLTISEVRASLTTSSSSGLPQFDVKKNGVTIFSTKPTIDVGEKTSVTAATPPVLSVTSVTSDDELTFDIVTAGTGATGAKITILATL